MSIIKRDRPLIIVFPHDLSFPIYNFPDDDKTALFAQVIAALLLNCITFGCEEPSKSSSILSDFIREMRNTGAIYAGSEATLVLPNDYKRSTNYLDILKRIFEMAGIPLHVNFWEDFNQDESVALMAVGKNLNGEDKVRKFVSRIKNRIDDWKKLVEEYLPQDLI